MTTQTLVWILFREFKEVIFLPNTFLTVRSKAAREMWHIAGESKFSPKSKAPWAGHGWIVQSQVYFCPRGITSLCAKLLVWKYENMMSPVQSFAWKSSHFSWFSWETFCTSTRSANGSSAWRWKWTSAYTLFCFIRMLFFRPRLNILIFLPILGWKHSCIILKL